MADSNIVRKKFWKGKWVPVAEKRTVREKTIHTLAEEDEVLKYVVGAVQLEIEYRQKSSTSKHYRWNNHN